MVTDTGFALFALLEKHALQQQIICACHARDVA
jgi:hypothetical protein